MAWIRLGVLASIVLALASPLSTHAQATDLNAEAQVFFDRGNELFEQAGQARGRRQRRLLEEALTNYVSTLRIVRSRNALFNAAIVLEQLGRPAQAFGYYREYMAIPGLTDAERTQAQTRIDGIRPQVAIVSIGSTPPGAEVFIDRLDLAARGSTPLEIALPPGEHIVFLRHPHYEDSRGNVTAVTGESRSFEQELTARPVALTLLGEGQLTLDGNPVEAGTHSLAPGVHVARLVVPGRAPVERRIELNPGEPVEVTLRPGETQNGTIRIASTISALVTIDGEEVGTGTHLDATALAGAHRIRVEAAGRPAFEQVVHVEAGQTTLVRVNLGRQSERRFGALPHVALVTSALSATAFGILALRSSSRANRYEDACDTPDPFGCNRDERDRVRSANRQADGVLGLTGALVVTTIVLYVLNRSSEQATTADVQVSRNGATVGVGGRF